MYVFQLLATHEEVVIIAEPYITDYLALRVAGLVAKVVRRFLDRNPDIRPDVLICDGNGRFHSRGMVFYSIKIIRFYSGCGAACHIGAKSGVAFIGVAKNLNLSLLVALKASKEVVEKAEKLVESVLTEENDGYVPFDLILPVTLKVVRIGGSKVSYLLFYFVNVFQVPVFVSAGYGIELDLATEIVMKCARNRICEPIRMVRFYLSFLFNTFFSGRSSVSRQSSRIVRLATSFIIFVVLYLLLHSSFLFTCLTLFRVAFRIKCT